MPVDIKARTAEIREQQGKSKRSHKRYRDKGQEKKMFQEQIACNYYHCKRGRVVVDTYKIQDTCRTIR